jgi:hypothetical protein
MRRSPSGNWRSVKIPINHDIVSNQSMLWLKLKKTRCNRRAAITTIKV